MAKVRRAARENQSREVLERPMNDAQPDLSDPLGEPKQERISGVCPEVLKSCQNRLKNFIRYLINFAVRLVRHVLFLLCFILILMCGGGSRDAIFAIYLLSRAGIPVRDSESK